MKQSPSDGLLAIVRADEQQRQRASRTSSNQDTTFPVGETVTEFAFRETSNGTNNESSNTGTVVCDDVRQDDVLCGRGSKSNRHPGNIRYRNLVKQQKMRYLRADRLRKGEIASEILQTIRHQGGRFLLPMSPTEFVEIEDDKAKDKVSQALREGLSQRLYNRMHKKGIVSGTAALASTRGLSSENQSMSDFKLPCKKRKVIDTRSPSADTSIHSIRSGNDIVPTDDDVLLGKGKAIQDHPGNIRFRDLVNKYRDRYQAATRKSEKARISFEIVRVIRERGGRFLKYDNADEKYSDVGDEQAKEKVSHACRNRKAYSHVVA